MTEIGTKTKYVYLVINHDVTLNSNDVLELLLLGCRAAHQRAAKRSPLALSQPSQTAPCHTFPSTTALLLLF